MTTKEYDLNEITKQSNTHLFTAETDRRIYYVYHIDYYGEFYARFQAKNPKTGKGWQATRLIGTFATLEEAIAATKQAMAKK